MTAKLYNKQFKKVPLDSRHDVYTLQTPRVDGSQLFHVNSFGVPVEKAKEIEIELNLALRELVRIEGLVRNEGEATQSLASKVLSIIHERDKLKVEKIKNDVADVAAGAESL